MDTFSRKVVYKGLERSLITINVNRAQGDSPPVTRVPNGGSRMIPGTSFVHGHPNGILAGDPLFVVRGVKKSLLESGHIARVGGGERIEVSSTIAGAKYVDEDHLGLEEFLVYAGTAPILNSSEQEGVQGTLTATQGGRRLEANQSDHTFYPGEYRCCRAPRTMDEVDQTVRATGKRGMSATKQRPGLYTGKFNPNRDYFTSMHDKVDAGLVGMDDRTLDVDQRNIKALLKLVQRLSGADIGDIATRLETLVEEVMTGGAASYDAQLLEAHAAAWVNRKRSEITSRCLEVAPPGSVKLITS